MSGSILFRLLRDFDVDVKRVPEAMRRVGVTGVLHRRPSQSTDVFRGELQLGPSRLPALFTIGMNPAVGAMMSLRMPSITRPAEITALSAAAEEWFQDVWLPTIG
jgi:hypothetical protein